MPDSDAASFDGGCTCRAVRFRLRRAPLVVHCCHCTSCQRETGSAFALNAMIESDEVDLLSGSPDLVQTPTASGAGQKIARCPSCRVAVWSHYAGSGDAIRFVRVGTLDEPARLSPDIHIFTSTQARWLTLPADVPAVSGYYDRKTLWRAESLERHAALRERTKR